MASVAIDVHSPGSSNKATPAPAEASVRASGPRPGVAVVAVMLLLTGLVNVGLNAVTVYRSGSAQQQAVQQQAANALALATSGTAPDGRLKVNFMFGGNYAPYDFLENLPGAPETQTGFGFEFAQEVCRVGDLDCRFVRDSYDNCWTSGNTPGLGVQDGWYQACSTYTNTFLRQTSVQFGASYTQGRPAGILTRLDAGGQPVVSPSSNLDGVTVAVVGGWATNQESLRYIVNDCTDALFSGFSTVTPADANFGPDAAVRALLDGTVDAVYLYASTIEDRSNPDACALPGCDLSLYQDRLGTDYAFIHTGIYDYQANGTTLSFTHQGSDLNAVLDPLVQEVIESEFYADLCNRWTVEKGFDDISCFPNEFMNSTVDRVAPGSKANNARSAEFQDCASGYCACPAA